MQEWGKMPVSKEWGKMCTGRMGQNCDILACYVDIYNKYEYACD